MAQSRLEKIGTIFTRVQGLLRAGAMRPEDKPIWYDVYAAFPPKAEPSFDRPAAVVPIRNIFYKEDVTRAKLHKQNKPSETISLFDHKRQTQSQQFLQIYGELESQGALDDQKIYETALDLLAEQRQQNKTSQTQNFEESFNEPVVEHKSQLLSDFQVAEIKPPAEKTKREPKDKAAGVNIESLFKD
ncbi:uncharacterized protein Dwil_GK15119 [Drosophila willistoni]|uniref:Small ribosomal subunit protein mS23 n=1 Tax=Drosophila willistoni TaxID=7260 RepID=B4MVQ8_DROWI|nr:probable 28S ribosomal protein S23, mitochondrial [Drosophila willistoni]EDW75778.1 uncharacterized protein Dwil_GK15119 [Drosophila willistoni]